jgi:hypothetical protein
MAACVKYGIVSNGTGANNDKMDELESPLYQLVFRAIETPHAGIGLVPNAKVLELREDLFAGSHKLFHVPPVHTDESNGSIPALISGRTKCQSKKGSKLRRRHLADSHSEFLMTNPSQAADVPVNGHVVGWVREYQVSDFTAEKCFVCGLVPSISANEAVTPSLPHVAASSDRGVFDERDFVLATI